MKHELPTLTFSYEALEPYLDRRTIKVHYEKHHQGYVKKLNKCLENYPELQKLSLLDLLLSIDQVPAAIRVAVRRNGGGHFNHTLFWSCMTAKQKSDKPNKEIDVALKSAFGGFKSFQDKFEKAANLHFASGWAWLCVDEVGKLVIKTLPNHEWPMLHGLEPLLTLDLWEHAYYLKYENKRKEYASAFWNIVDWAKVNERFCKAQDNFQKIESTHTRYVS